VQAPRTARMKGRHTRLRLGCATAAAGLLLLVLALSAVELLSRVLCPHWAPARSERVKFWRYHPTLGWAHRPLQQGRFTHRDFAVDVSVNSLGLRDRERCYRRGSSRRILVLGDSFAWGYGVEAEERFSGLIEAERPVWEVVNAAVAGYGTDQSFLYLSEEGLRFEPDVVLLLLTGNDFRNNIAVEEYWRFKPRFTLQGGRLVLTNTPVPRASVSQRLERFFYGRTYAWSKAYRGYQRLRGTYRASVLGLPSFSSGSEQAEVTAELLRACSRLCREHECEFVLVSVPMPRAKRAVALEVADSESFPYLPLDGRLLRSPAPVTFPHDEHWNPAGHRLAADAISKLLIRLRIFAGRPSGATPDDSGESAAEPAM